MHYTAAPDQLPELTLAADRAQSLLDVLLTDLEHMPSSSIEFRLSAMKQLMDALYRLTAVRKTLVAMRASLRLNADGLRSITSMVQLLHQQMSTLRTRIGTSRSVPPTPTSPASGAPSASSASFQASSSSSHPTFTPTHPPTIQQLISTPRLPDSPSPIRESPSPVRDGCLQPPTSVGGLNDAPQGATTGGAAAAPAATAAPPNIAGPAGTEFQSTQPDPFAPLAARIPPSLSNPDFQLPERSSRAADFAHAHDLDLVPLTHCVPTLSLAAPDLQTRIRAQLDAITDTAINLRADINPPIPQPLPTASESDSDLPPEFDFEFHKAWNNPDAPGDPIPLTEPQPNTEPEVPNDFAANPSPDSSFILPTSSFPEYPP